MWIEFLFLFLKGFGFIAAAMCTAFVGAASQWSNSDTNPSKLQWYIMAAVTLGAGFGAQVAFMNNSYGDFMNRKNLGGGNPSPGSDTPGLTPTPVPAQPSVMTKLSRTLGLAWAFCIIAIVSVGCAYMHSTTSRYDPTSGKLVEKTSANAYALFDANSQMTKFRNQSSPSTNASGTFAPGTYMAGLDQNASSTNLNALAATILQATAAGLVQGMK